MNTHEWLQRCTARLEERWPRIPREQLAEVAAEIHSLAIRQLEEPENACADWLARGLPAIEREGGAECNAR